MSVRILLAAHWVYNNIPKEFILNEMPESILAQALQGDPEAKEIEIPSADVTPRALWAILHLSEGKTPVRSESEYFAAARYLNYPLLGAFSSRLYDQLDKVNINCESNRARLATSDAIKTILPYLVWRHFDFSFITDKALCLWLSQLSGAECKFLLSQPGVNPLKDLSGLWSHARYNYGEFVMARLIDDPRVQNHLNRSSVLYPKFIENYPQLSLRIALLPETAHNRVDVWTYTDIMTHLVKEGDYESVEEILKNPQAIPSGEHVYTAAQLGFVNTLTMLLTRRDINLSPPGPNDIMIMAALGGHVDCVRVLLADGRFSMRCLTGNFILQRYPELGELYDLTT